MWKAALICILLQLFGAAFASDVLEWTDADFDDKIRQHSLVLVKFYAPWCGHCKKLAPEFEIAASTLKNNDPPVTLVKVDCTVEKKTCGKFDVTGYPTLKIFNDGKFSSEYSGGRDAQGIQKFMASRAGPSSKELKTIDELNKFWDKALTEPIIIGFFSVDSDLQKKYQSVGDKLSTDFNFAHTYDMDLGAHFGYEEAIVIFRPKKLKNKFEPQQLRYTGEADTEKINNWIIDNAYGLCGVRTEDNEKYFQRKPIFTAFYNLNYERDPKGSNYRRNRVMIAANAVTKDRENKAYFSVSDVGSMEQSKEFGIDAMDKNKVHVVALDAENRKYKMKEAFGVEALQKWITSVLDGKEELYMKSEEIPETNDGPVKVVVAKTFESIVNDPEKDVLIEFYAPWCGHCNKLAPIYEQLGEAVKNDKNLVIAKMDATENDVPAPYEVHGFPSIYFAPKGNKSKPLKYEGNRELNNFVEYLAKKSTEELVNYDRNGVLRSKSDL